MRRLIVGCGYLGQRVAAAWRERGDEVFVTTRSASRAADLQACRYTPIVADVTDPDSLPALPSVQTVLFAVGFDRASGHSIEQVYVDGLNHTLAALGDGVQRFIYISTTGVYGQANGEWVDESSPCEPTRPGGKACLAAEQRLHESLLADQSIVLRLSGIYGPGRVPNLHALQAGQPIIAPTGSYLNLIHVEDATMAVVAAAEHVDVPATYVVSDNRPVLRRDYYRELARLSEVDPDSIEFVDGPSEQTGVAASASAQRKVGSKRVRSELIMRTLELRWDYPGYQAGLAAILTGQHD